MRDKVLVSDEGIIMRLSDSKVLGNIPGNIDEILFGLDVETDLGYLNRSFDTSNDGNFEGFLIRDLLWSTYGKVIGFDEGIKQRYTDGKVIRTILGNVDGITLRLDVKLKLGSLDV